MSDETRVSRPSRLGGLGTAAGLTAAFLALSFSHSLSSFIVGFGGHKVLESAIDEPIWGTALGRDLAFFALAQMALHGLLALTIFALASLTQAAWPNLQASRRKLAAAWFVITASWLLIANATLFPHSAVAGPFVRPARAHVLGLSAFAWTTIIGASAVAAVLVGVARRHPPRRHTVRRAVVATGVLTAACAGIALTTSHEEPGSARGDTPHVIMIGIDSLRRDIVSPGGERSLAPTLSEFLDQSVVFDDAITPLARTFPSWISLLTGRHPHTTGAVVNLIPRELVRTGPTLPQLLRGTVYRTVFATDEVRFSNIDASYGFDQVITPPMGAADFLLGILNDTPLSNLIVNTWLGQLLFPHAYANRAAAITYDPDTFLRRIDKALDFVRPTFFAVHLTLPHWPYIWSDAPVISARGDGAIPPQYRASIRRVDAQFRDLMAMLDRHGALDNAIVIVFSDHGEALGSSEDSLLPPSPAGSRPRVNVTPWGHGTSVLSPHQYRIVLGLRTFGRTPLGELSAGRISAPVTIEDVAPTLLDALAIQSPKAFDGISLMPLIRDGHDIGELPGNRVRFTETEFNPGPFVAGLFVPSPSQLEQSAKHYTVDPETGRVRLRRNRLREMLRQREYAALSAGALLVAQASMEGKRFRYLFIREPGTFPVPVEAPPEPDGDALMLSLWTRLHARFPELSASPGREVEAERLVGGH